MSINFIQLPPCPLEAFLNTSDESFDVAGFIYNDGVTPVDPSDIGDICFATIEPRTERAELISFTIDSVTAEGVATLTAVRGLSQKTPYSTGGATFDHQAGSNLVISNNPGLLNHFAVKDNDETIAGDWKVPDPSTPMSIVNKTYVDTKVSKTGDETIAGVKSFSSPVIVPNGVVDTEAVNKLQLEDALSVVSDAGVKLDGDQTIDDVKTFTSSPKVPDATSADEPYTKGQHDSDATASSAVASPTVRGSAKLDVVADDVLDPEVLTATADRVAAMAGNGGTPDVDNTFITQEGGTIITEKFTADGTWTKNAHAKRVEVWAIGAGGGGGGGREGGNDIGFPGTGGGVSFSSFLASSLGATVSISVGIGGIGGVTTGDGTNGGDSSFGTHVTAQGGRGGLHNNSTLVPGGLGNYKDGGDSLSDVSSMAPTAGGKGGGSGVLSDGRSRIVTTALSGGVWANNLSGGAGNPPLVSDGIMGGTGGGGGDTNSSGTYDGGDGAEPGGGGGGGGYGLTSFDNGTGGDGGKGVVFVITYL